MNLPTTPDTQFSLWLNPTWRAAGATIGLSLLVLIVAYWATIYSAEHLWRTSSAYNYGYLIAPISLFLIWREREALRHLNPQPSVLGLPLIVGFGACWLAAELMDINEGRHIAFVGMLHGVFLSALGPHVYRRLAFPFFYLWLLVPTGEFLHEPLQIISRDGAIVLLKAFAIPVFSEGWTIEVPTGTFIVETGCSGLNFVLASFALALLYGKLNYRKWSTRAVTILVAIGIAILANIVRVFLIIALTEWSDRRIAIADDHVFFGWVFFGIAMFIAMWWGMKFADTDGSVPVLSSNGDQQPKPSILKAGVVAATMAVVLAAYPMFAAITDHDSAEGIAIVSLPESVNGWAIDHTAPLLWSPGLAESDSSAQAVYVQGGQRINIAVSICSAQWSGCDVAASGNMPVNPETPIWTNGRSEQRELQISGRPASVLETQYLDRGGLYVLMWYESAGCITASRLQSKVCAARQRFRGASAPGAFVAIAAEVGVDANASLAALESFAAQWPESKTILRVLPR